jgi:serine/threonine-protein phosphatase 2B regulatory subunit
MGNSASTNNIDNSSINFGKNELKILYKNFVKLDTDATGYLEPNEFFDIPELKDNPIVQRIIKVFDRNGDGKISFYEFICGLSNLTNSGNIESIIL